MGDLATLDKEEPEALNDFHASVSNGKCCSHTAQVEKRKCGDWKAEHPKSTVEEDQVCDRLRNLNVYKPMGHNEIHLRVLRELSDKVAKP